MPKNKQGSDTLTKEPKRAKTNGQVATEPQSLGIRIIPGYLQELANTNQLEAFTKIINESAEGSANITFLIKNTDALLNNLIQENKFDYVDAFINVLEQQINKLKPQQRQIYPPIKNLILGLITDNYTTITFARHYADQVDLTQNYAFKGVRFRVFTCDNNHGYPIFSRSNEVSKLFWEQIPSGQLKGIFLLAVREMQPQETIKKIVNKIVSLEDFLNSLTIEELTTCLKAFFNYQMLIEFKLAYKALKTKFPNYQNALLQSNLFEYLIKINWKYSFLPLNTRPYPPRTNGLPTDEPLFLNPDIFLPLLEILLTDAFNLFTQNDRWVKIISGLIPYHEHGHIVQKFITKIQELWGQTLSPDQWKDVEENFMWSTCLFTYPPAQSPSATNKVMKNLEILFTLHPSYQPMENNLSSLIVQSFLKAVTTHAHTGIRYHNIKEQILNIFYELYGTNFASALLQQQPYLLTLESDPVGIFRNYLAIVLENEEIIPQINYDFILPLLKKALLVPNHRAHIGYEPTLEELNQLTSILKVDTPTIVWDLIEHLIDTYQAGECLDLTAYLMLSKLFNLLKLAPNPPQTNVFSKIAHYYIQHLNNPETPYRLREVERFLLENMHCRGPMRQALTLAARANLKKGAQLEALHTDRQSTHGTGVHKSCSETAKKLWEKYFANRFPEANQREEEVQKALTEFLHFYYQNALTKVRPLHQPFVQKYYEEAMHANWESLSTLEQAGYLQIFTYLLPAKLADSEHVLYPLIKNKIYWLDKDFTAYRFLRYCQLHFFKDKDSSGLEFYQILASLWRAIEDESAIVDKAYQQEIKEKHLLDLLASLAREYNTSIYQTIFLVDTLPGPEILTTNIIYANAIYITADGTVFLTKNTDAQLLSIPAELAVSVFSAGNKLTDFTKPLHQQDVIAEAILNPFWDSLETLGISRYSNDIPTCFGGSVNATMSLLDGQHPLVFTDQVTSSRILNFIVDFYEPKFEALSSDEKDNLAQYIITEQTLPKSFVDSYVNEFKQSMQLYVKRGALKQDEIDCWFIGDELPVSLFKVINTYCEEKKKAAPPSPREQLSLFQPAPNAPENPAPIFEPQY